MINKIMAFSKITCCDLPLIVICITWDQKWGLYTGGKFTGSYSWDNYRLITGKIYFYPQGYRYWIKPLGYLVEKGN